MLGGKSVGIALELHGIFKRGWREAKGHTHNRPGQRPGKKQRIFSEGQRPVSYLISKSYIDTQEEHHLTKTFQEEYRELLGKYHIEFDERYLGD